MEENKNETIEILKKARELIRRGWARATFALHSQGEVCYCALGAIGPAAGLYPGDGVFPSDGDRFQSAVSRAAAALMIALSTEEQPGDPLDYGRVFSWNDDPKRTQEDVIALYDRAIASLEAQDKRAKRAAKRGAL